MSDLTLATLLLGAFVAGAYLALFVRALIGQSSDRRVREAAQAALDPDAVVRLSEYLAMVDDHERARVKVVLRDG
jgi:hypothetical protein